VVITHKGEHREGHFLTLLDLDTLNRKAIGNESVFYRGFVEILAAQQTNENATWYQGTADAVRQNLRYLDDPAIGHVLVLSGDQLYRMDFRQLVAFHESHGADVTVAALRVGARDASRYGILKTDADGRITTFVEKPADADVLAALRTPGSRTRPYLASMGIYLFGRQVLLDLLRGEHTDFGKGIIPESIERQRVYAYPFEGYWEDIGTIAAFFEANLALIGPQPALELRLEETPWYTRSRHLPPSRCFDCRLDRVLMAEGCLLERVTARRAVIGLRSTIGSGTIIEESVLMGADWFGPEEQGEEPAGLPPGIGRDCVIRRAIIDKNVRIGDGVRIENKDGLEEADLPCGIIRDGIVVIPRGTTVPSGTLV
jgi:glucose-1-phosphate adenylyltransferase